MKIKPDMLVSEVLAFDEDKMIQAFTWIAPEFERLRNPLLRKVMSGRVTVSQAARIAQIPVAEALYVLNLAVGENAAAIAEELECLPKTNYEFCETNPPNKPREIAKINDAHPKIILVDVMRQHERREDPLPKIMSGFFEIKANSQKILLVRHPFDPIPLRDLFARESYASWAEERRPGDWYIYFYRPTAKTAAVVHPPIYHQVFEKAAAAWA